MVPATRRHRRLRPVRAAEREVDELAIAGRHHVARGLRCESRVQGDLVQQVGLHELRDRDRCGDLQDRLVRVHDPAFRHGSDVTGEAQSAEGPERAAIEPVLAEVGEIVLGE
jgi:hypothetical protein